jgi:hypothetical protein
MDATSPRWPFTRKWSWLAPYRTCGRVCRQQEFGKNPETR